MQAINHSPAPVSTPLRAALYSLSVPLTATTTNGLSELVIETPLPSYDVSEDGLKQPHRGIDFAGCITLSLRDQNKSYSSPREVG